MKKKINWNWIIKLTIITFIISIVFSTLSELVLSKSNIITSILITILFVSVGIIFDMIGVAVTSADLAPLTSMASQKIKGSKKAITLKKNASKVASFCNDVVGDITGIISGSTGAVIAIGIANKFNYNLIVTSIVVMATISAITIGGKAILKNIAIQKGDKIIFKVAKLLTIKKEK